MPLNRMIRLAYGGGYGSHATAGPAGPFFPTMSALPRGLPPVSMNPTESRYAGAEPALPPLRSIDEGPA